MQQDFLLIQKMKKGDEAAMEIFVRRYYAQILQYCSYHCADQMWAEDLTQETFERFFRKLVEYRHQGKALNYLYTIARNLCIDRGRKQREVTAEEPGEREKTAEAAGKDEAGRAEEKLLIGEALGKLPAELRDIVILHYFQEFSLREIAGILGIGLPLVKYRMKKAKERLRDLLGEDEVSGKVSKQGAMAQSGFHREEESTWKD